MGLALFCLNGQAASIDWKSTDEIDKVI